MAYYILFAHLEKSLVKVGDVLNGKNNVGIIGSSGNSTAKHLHLQVETELPTGYAAIRGFDKFTDPTNPSVVIDKYGKMCQNDITQGYLNQWSGNSSSILGGRHSGIDYSGVIDKPYESKYCYSPDNGKCKVIAVGSDPYNPPNWGGYGNYVILELLGSETKDVNHPNVYTKAVGTGSWYSKDENDNQMWLYKKMKRDVPTYNIKTGKRSGTIPKGKNQQGHYWKKNEDGIRLVKFESKGQWHYFEAEYIK